MYTNMYFYVCILCVNTMTSMIKTNLFSMLLPFGRSVLCRPCMVVGGTAAVRGGGGEGGGGGKERSGR